MPEFSSRVSLAAGHPCLAGHFPGRPVVPAVMLLDLAALKLERHVAGLRLLGVAHAKFLLPVLPEQELELQLWLEAPRAAFRYTSPQGVVAHGEFRIGTVP